MIKEIWIIFLFCTLSLFSFSQGGGNSGNATNLIRDIVPPSPQSMVFQRYGDYPVNLSAGLPQIEIPLYEVVSRKLKLPISLSYHLSGFRVNDDNGEVGLGWALNAGGRISRTTMGLPDELSYAGNNPPKYVSNVNGNNVSDQLYMTGLALGEGYYAPDLFYFSGGLGNGRFCIKNTGVQSAPIDFKTLEFRALKIVSNLSNGINDLFTWFEISDETGTIYRYGKSLEGNVNNIERTSPQRSDGLYYNSAWLLSEIISADRTDTIKLKYFNNVYKLTQQRTDNLTIEYNKVVFQDPDYGGTLSCQFSGVNNSPHPSYSQSFQTPKSDHFISLLKEITFVNGKVEFIYGNVETNGTIPDGTELRKIKIYNQNGLQKRIELIQSYYDNQAGSPFYRKLNEVKFYDKNTAENYSYKFDYHQSAVPVPSTRTINFGIDYYGYFNGKTNNNGLLPPIQLPMYIPNVSVIGSADRQPDYEYAKTYTLKKITYPTGGHTLFETEGNQLSNTKYGGLRLKSITNFSADNMFVSKNEYLYNSGVSLFGSNTSENMFGKLYKTGYYCTAGTSADAICTVNNNPYCQRNYTSNVMVYKSEFQHEVNSFESNSLNYSSITEVIKDNSGNTSGKIEYEFTVPTFNTYGGEAYNYFLGSINNWDKSQLKLKSVFKSNAGAASYSLVEKEENSFTKIDKETIISVNAFTTYYNSQFNDVYFGLTSPGINIFYFNGGFSTANPLIPILFYDFKIKTGAMNLTQSKKTIIDDNNNQLITTTNYSYDNVYNLPISVLTADSKGRQIKTDNKYPFSYSGSTVYNEMIIRNFINPVIDRTETNISLNNKEISKEVMNFNLWGSNSIIAPNSFQKSISGNGLETEIIINSYDNKGNVLQMTGKDGVATSYLWGYNRHYPVAKIVNASQSIVQPYITQSLLDNAVGGSDDVTIRSHLNNLRNIPNTYVTTYTYQPLIGITSQTDPRGKTTYYEYDAFNRLKLVKDQDGNIVKKICYNYAGQPENCNN